MDFSHPPLDDMDYIRQEALGFAGIGLLRVAASGAIASVDETALKVLDVAEGGDACPVAAGSNLRDLTSCPIPVDRLVNELRRSARIRREEVSFLASDGAERWVQFDCYLVRDPGSGKEFLQFVLQDVTQRRRALQLDRIRQMAIDSSISPVAMADLDGTITYANDALAGLWGYGKVEEVIGQFAQDFWADERMARYVGLRLVQHNHWSGQLTAKRKNETHFEVHLSATRVLDADGSPLCFMVSCIDISEQKRIEEELRKRIETERLIVRISTQLVSRMAHDLDSSITAALAGLGTFADAACAALILADLPRGLVKHVFEWWKTPTSPVFHKLAGSSIEEYRFLVDRLADGQTVTFRGVPDHIRNAPEVSIDLDFMRQGNVLVVPVRHHEETIGVFALWTRDETRSWSEHIENAVRIVGEIVANVVSRQNAENEVLRRVEFERIVTAVSSQFIGVAPEEIDDAIESALRTVGEFLGVDRCYLNWVSDETGTLLDSFEWCADGIQSFKSVISGAILVEEFPWAVGQFGQGNPLVLHTLDDLPEVARRERRLMEGQHIQSLLNVPIMVSRRLIGVFGFETVNHVQRWSDDDVVMATIIGQVFGNAMLRKEAESERQHLEAQVQHAQKLESLGVLAGGIAHDFNNILMGIIGNAGLAMLDLPSDSPARECIVHIEQAAHHAAELTTQLLAYSGKGAFSFRPVDLTRVVEEMMHLIEAAISKRAFLNVRLNHDLPEIEGDAGQLRQVILNLVTNASDAVEATGGNIRVTTGVMKADAAYLGTTYIQDDLQEGQYVFIEVADTGCGMEKQIQSRIFDPFFSTKFPGRGLGLAAVLGIARAHRSAIKVDSTLGEGTVIRVLFPCRAATEVPRETAEDIEYEVGGSVVLVVDDEPVVRRIARLTLERFGYEVLLAEDGRDGVEVFAANQGSIDCILLDMTMPVMDGAEAYAEIRKLDPKVPVILSSGYTEIEASERYNELKLLPFIQKPYTTVALVEMVSRVVRERAANP